jgi:hypothetical protein
MDEWFLEQRNAQRHGMRPRRAEQCLPQEVLLRSGMRRPTHVKRDHGIPYAARSRFAGIPVRRFGAFHSRKLQRSTVSQKLFNPFRSELTGRVKLKGYKKNSFSVIALSWQMS